MTHVKGQADEPRQRYYALFRTGIIIIYVYFHKPIAHYFTMLFGFAAEK